MNSERQPQTSGNGSTAGLLELWGALKELEPQCTIQWNGHADVRLTGVRQDSRGVLPGELFAARPGKSTDGLKYLAEAIANGASAVMLSPSPSVDIPDLSVPVICVADISRCLAHAAHWVYGRPTRGLRVIGITGTNGKTSTAAMVRTILESRGERVGVVGTLGVQFGDKTSSTVHTSPEADEMARISAMLVAEGADRMIMEVSSIAVAAHRIDGIDFRIAAHLNLSQDHLDYHGSMAAYAAAKADLFLKHEPLAMVLNVEDDLGARLAREVSPQAWARVAPTGRAQDVEFALVRRTVTATGQQAIISTPVGRATLRLPLIGAHNVENAIHAIAIAWLAGLDPRDACEALAGILPAPGRLEACHEVDSDIRVYVDYCHTPDALVRALSSVREQLQEGGRLWCVFGCGGDRDSEKRPLMGRAVGEGADIAIVTNDNPRSEDPQLIASQILTGMSGTTAAHRCILERKLAIETAVLEASAGDLILVAGKGHETYQIIGSRTLSFDDRVEARTALAARRVRTGSSN